MRPSLYNSHKYENTVFLQYFVKTHTKATLDIETVVEVGPYPKYGSFYFVRYMRMGTGQNIGLPVDMRLTGL